MRKLAPLGLAAVTALAIGCQEHVASLQQTNFFDRAAMDSATAPADDFFSYANGGWLKKTTIPDEYSSWGSFTTLYDENLKKLRTLLDEVAAKQQEKGSLEQKAGEFYASGMDTVAIEKVGAAPLQAHLAQITAVKNYNELLDLLAAGFRDGNADLVQFYVGADDKNSAMNIPVFPQQGITLPEKGYYTRPDSASKAIRDGLVKTAAKYFTMTGTPQDAATKMAEQLLALETKIAAAHRTPVELRDPVANYNKMAATDLAKLAPNVDWKKILPAMGMSADSVNVGQPGYLKGLSDLLASEPIEAWKAKVAFDYIHDHAELLSKEFQVTHFEFSRQMSGQKQMPERWKQVVEQSDSRLQDILGQLYVAKHFPPEAKLRMDTLVDNLQVAFKARIEKLDWMSPVTKEKAVAKLNTFLKKIGYPSKWKNYDDVTIDRSNWFANNQSLGRHAVKEMLDKIGKPVDRTEWGMTPSTVNAYYNPTFNEIVFPAGILQFPFFHMNADDAINYGGIGMVIGHEMTHGFDDQGAQYDAQGNMVNWWQADDAKKFKDRGAAMIGQYNGFKMFDSLHVNGELTLGENLADLGGLAIAWDAFKMTKQGKSNEKIDGFTPDQRFFLGFAQIWRVVIRPESAKTRLNVDPHSPAQYRVNGPLTNFDPFYATFHVTENNKMFRKSEERIRIW
jgi:putative endopeptidase